MIRAGIGTLPLAFFGTPDQQEKYLAGLSTGKLIGAFGLTEPDAGWDALNARTTAVLGQTADVIAETKQGVYYQCRILPGITDFHVRQSRWNSLYGLYRGICI